MRPKVYLAGPIQGLNYAGATEWRDEAKKLLYEHCIDGYSPMRAKQYLKDEKAIGDNGPYTQPLSTNKAILSRDFRDCTQSDVVIMNLHGAKRVSIGSVMEVAWAHAARVPVILIMEPSGNVHEHCLLCEACNIRVETIEEAVICAVAIIHP